MIKIKRIYSAPKRGDGFRILVDRLWPRGLLKEKAQVGLWMKEIAPSNRLRKWFAHDIKKWLSFRKKYMQELKGKNELINEIKRIEKEKKFITLLFSTQDEQHNNAVVLMEYLRRAE